MEPVEFNDAYENHTGCQKVNLREIDNCNVDQKQPFFDIDDNEIGR